jgi:glycine betaine/proline transport system substrate-binding protein
MTRIARCWIGTAALAALTLGMVAGCGGSTSDPDGAGASTEMHFVYVNWVEGIAITHMLHEVLEDSLGMDVTMTRVNGGGVAFSSVASGSADIFVEAWLPTTHKDAWAEYNDRVHKLGLTYQGTSVGLVVPAYMDISDISELPNFRDELDGTINGIESGAAINGQTRQILENNGITGFDVLPSSGPAMVSALQRAIANQEPIVITGWKPHWMWSRFDLTYIPGAKTNDTPVFGAPENIYTVVRNDFEADYPETVVRFLKAFEVNDPQLNRLMEGFQPDSDQEPLPFARQWIRDHRDVVHAWLEAARSDTAEVAPDSLAAQAR